jgi:hypothetical protein
MKFKETCQEVEEPTQEVQPAEPEASEEVVLECSQHKPLTFMKGKS